MRTSLLFASVLGVSIVASACSSSSSPPATNPSPGPGTGGSSTGGSGGAGGSESGGTSAAGTSSGGTSSGGTGGSGSGDPQADVAGCTFATAEDHTSDMSVTVMFGSGFNFVPSCIKVKTGTTVTLPGSSVHPLAGMKKAGTQPNPIVAAAGDGSTDNVTVMFTDVGAFGYYCKNHGSDGGTSAMVGAVYVTE